MEKFVMIQMTAAQLVCFKKLADAERAMLDKSIKQFDDGLARLEPPEEAEGRTYPT